MPYVLGVDVGSSYTTAAFVRREDERPTVLPLDDHPDGTDQDADRQDPLAGPVPSVLYVTDDDTVLVGQAALERAWAEPDRVARDFLARVGDDVPALVGQESFTAETLLAALVAWVVQRGVDIEGTDAERVVLAHPAGWGAYRRSLLDDALSRIGLTDVLLLPKPIAAAECYAATGGSGDALAVYDLGDSTLSCAVARRGPAAFDLLCQAETVEPVGGTHFDDVLAGHVLTELGQDPAGLDYVDPALWPAMDRLRLVCRTAKEALSTATDVTVPCALPGVRKAVPVTRDRFDALIRPAVDSTVDTLLRTGQASGVPAQRLGGVLLVGGSARVPLVAELVSAAAPCPVVLDPEPETAVARGAALAGRRAGMPELMPVQRRASEPDGPPRRTTTDFDPRTPPPRPPVRIGPVDVARRGALRRLADSLTRRRTS